MKEGLKLIAKGRLIETSWVYDHALEKGEYVEKDVTDQAVRLMFEPCDIADNLTLKDVFLLLNTELKIFDAIIGNWCEEIVTEGLTAPEKLYTGNYNPDEIEYLELYFTLWSNQEGKDGPSFYGYARPDLHGQGFILKEDLLHSWGDVEWPKGHRIPWSLSFIASNDLINIPLKLNKEIVVFNDNLDDKNNWHKEITKYRGAEYTLGNILYGIIWELSFHGGPQARDDAGEELKTIAQEIKDKKE